MSDNILVVDDTFREVVKMASNRAAHLAELLRPNPHFAGETKRRCVSGTHASLQHENGWKLAAVLAAVCDILDHPDAQEMQNELDLLYAATPEAREE